MSIIIEDMAAPNNCYQCLFYDEVTRYCDVKNKQLYKNEYPKPKWCPIKEVKE